MEPNTITLARHATAMEGPAAADRKPGGPAMRAEPGQELELARLGDQIAELAARIDAATYELLCHLREFDRGYGWEGWRSCAHWLNWRTGLDLGAAREKLRVAAALADLNHIAAAMARGQLSYSKVRALTRVATPATEAPLLALALHATASHVERLVRAWRQADRDAQPDAEQLLLASRMLSMRVDEDGMVVLRGRLPAEVGAVLMRAVEAALEQVPAPADGDDPTIAQRRADALGLVAESALAGGLDPGNSADRFQVTVHVQADTLAAREVDGEARRVAAETRAASPAAAEPPTTAAGATPHVAAEARATGTAAPELPGTATGAPPHVAAESRATGAAGAEPPTTAAGALAHFAAEARSTGTAAPDLPGTATSAPPHVAAESRTASAAAPKPPTTAAGALAHFAAEARSTGTAAPDLPDTATGAPPHVAAESRTASAAAPKPPTTAAGATPHFAAEARATGTAAPELPDTATVVVPHVAAESRATSAAGAEPPTTAAGALAHFAAEARSTGTAAPDLPGTATGAPPHVAAESRASAAAPVPRSAAADAAPHVAAESWSASPVAAEPPTVAAGATPHIAAGPWENGAHPEGGPMPGTAASVGWPLRGMRDGNGRGRMTANGASLRDQSAGSRRAGMLHEGCCAASAARSPLREVTRCSGGATNPSTPGPATVATAHASAETLQANAAAREWAAPDTDRDAGLAVIEQVGGLYLGREAARRVSCDAGLVVLRHGADGEVLDVGRRTRTVPSALRRAVQSRDHGQCQFPGCDSRRCDAHHVEHWAEGGATRLQNLISLCRFHHRAVHEQGFQVVAGNADEQFRFLRPDGEPLPAEPPVPSWEGAPLAPTDARLAAAGITIRPDTATPEWYGESLNLAAALDALWEAPATATRAGRTGIGCRSSHARPRGDSGARSIV